MADATGGPGLFTKDDLCRFAGVSQRLIDDWIKVGLLDGPIRRSLGRHGMAPGVWPENQMRLLVKLAELRTRVTRKNFAALCNVPVWTWLYHEDMCIPVRQVRRAVTTWGNAAGRVRPSNDGAARKMAAGWRQPGVPRRTQALFVDRVMNSLSDGGWDGEALARSTNVILGIQGKARLGPEDAQVSGDMYARHLALRLQTLRVLPEIPDAWFEEARVVYQRSDAVYTLRQPSLAQDPVVGRMHPMRDQSDVLNAACQDVLDILGLLWQTRHTDSRGDVGSRRAMAPPSPC